MSFIFHHNLQKIFFRSKWNAINFQNIKYKNLKYYYIMPGCLLLQYIRGKYFIIIAQGGNVL